jgi:simple sugar transport system substrate-binding protein/basic membrane protein A
VRSCIKKYNEEEGMKLRKKILIGLTMMCFLIAVLTLPVFASDGGEEAPEEDVLKVAAVFPGSINDQSWNSYGYAGMKDIEAKFGAEVAFSENVQPADQIDAIRDYASRGYDVIFAHGGQYEDASLRVAQEYPDTMFIVTCGAQGNKTNAVCVDVDRISMNFGLAYVAAKMSKTGHLGWITSLEGIPAVQRGTCGFIAGAKLADPNVKVSVIYLPDMEDIAKAREAALTMARQGADFIIGSLNRGIQGVIDVCKEEGLMTSGRLPSHVEAYPEGILTNQIEDYDRIYSSMIELWSEDNLTPGATYLGLEKGYHFDYSETSAWNPSVPADVLAELAEVIEGVENGSIPVDVNDQCDDAGIH